MIEPNSSAIIVLLKKINVEKAKAEIEEYQGKVLYSNLAFESEAELLQALS